MLKVGNKTEKHLPNIILFGWMIFIVAGCNPIAGPGTSEVTLPTESAQATETEGVVTQMNPSATPFASGLENLIEKAKEDLAQRLSISATQVNVKEAKAVTWSNSSLGCPQPGMAYADMITPGYLILLQTNDQEYEYHAGKGSDIFYCEHPLPPVEGVPGNT